MSSQYVYGLHTVETLLSSAPERVLEIWLQQDKRGELVDAINLMAERHGIAVQHVARNTLDKRTGNALHQGVVARCRPIKLPGEHELLDSLAGKPSRQLILALDRVQDPHNLGACLRTAEAAGVDAFLFQREGGSGITPTVSKVASGAAEIVPIYAVANLGRALRELKKLAFQLVGSAGDAPATLYQQNYAERTVLVMGAEGEGLRPSIKALCDVLVRIPMRGRIESLNVSVATGVCLYEIVRQWSSGG